MRRPEQRHGTTRLMLTVAAVDLNLLLLWLKTPTLLPGQVKIWNTRLRLMQLVESARDMAKHGPSKPPAEHGLDEVNREPPFVEKGELCIPCVQPLHVFGACWVRSRAELLMRQHAGLSIALFSAARL